MKYRRIHIRYAKLKAMLLAVLIMTGLFTGCGVVNDPVTDPVPAPPPSAAVDGAPITQDDDAPPDDEPNPQEDSLTGAHVRVGALRGPTGMGIAALMDRAGEGLTTNEYTFTIGGTPEEMNAGLVSGELDIAMVPSNLASVLYNRTEGDIRVLSINTLGLLYILDSTGEINSIEDLRGKTINATGQGAIPQYALEHILKGNGMEPGVDVEITYNAEHTELASLMVAGDVAIAMLPQPFVTTVTMQNSDIAIALDLTSEWEAVNPSTALIMGNIVVNASFLGQNPDAVELFLRDYEESVAFANSNPEEAAQIIERFDIVPAAVAQRAIPRSNLVHITGAEMRQLVEAFLQVMFEANPQSVGGALPDEGFYVIR